MKKIYLIALLAISISAINAQVYYSFSALSGTYTPITGTNAALTALTTGATPVTDDGYKNNINIGFTFNYNGTNYTKLHVCSNGYLAFGTAFTAAAATAPVYNSFHDLIGSISSDTINRPILAPFWADLDVQTNTASGGGGIQYKTTGTAPNRKFTVQWTNVLWNYSATQACIAFQVILYETSNQIDFVYQRKNGLITGDSATGFTVASIGITAAKRGTTNFISVSDTTTNPGFSRLTETVLTGRPQSGQIFRFTPITTLNDLAVRNVYTNGKIALGGDPQPIATEITNQGFSTVTNVPVYLNVTGANSFADTVTISSLSSGRTVYIPFKSFVPTNYGINTLTVSIPSDDDNTNNSSTANHTVTSDIIDYTTNAAKFGLGTTSQNIDFATLFTNPNTHLIKNIFLNFAPNGINGQQPYTVAIYDTTGFDVLGNQAPGATAIWTDTTLTSHDGLNTVTISPSLSVTGSFYVVVSQTDTSKNLSFAYERENPIRLGTFFYDIYGGQSGNNSGWIDFAYTTSFAPRFAVGVQYDNVVLPVTFTKFTGNKLNNKANQLNWTTSVEKNNNGFELQRSNNGKDFVKIDFIKSKALNNFKGEYNYTYLDETPSAGTNYYRLKQIDNNGHYSFSNIVKINSENTNIEVTTIYPNPVHDVLRLNINSKDENSASISIYDITGKIIGRYPIQLKSGVNNFTFQMNALKVGNYTLRVETNNGSSKPIEFEKL